MPLHETQCLSAREASTMTRCDRRYVWLSMPSPTHLHMPYDISTYEVC